MELARIIYYSTPMLEGRVQTSIADEIDVILHTSRIRNKKHDITGALFFAPKLFAQILEGPIDVVSTRYASICRDSRHTAITLSLREQIESRIFNDWSMAYLDEMFLSGPISPKFNPIEDLNPKELTPEDWMEFYRSAHKYLR